MKESLNAATVIKCRARRHATEQRKPSCCCVSQDAMPLLLVGWLLCFVSCTRLQHLYFENADTSRIQYKHRGCMRVVDAYVLLPPPAHPWQHNALNTARRSGRDLMMMAHTLQQASFGTNRILVRGQPSFFHRPPHHDSRDKIENLEYEDRPF